MSQFYGTLKGMAGEATRRGSKESGIEIYAASWEGAVRVYVFWDEKQQQDRVVISFTPWHGHGGVKQDGAGYGKSFVLYDGPVSPTVDELRQGLRAVAGLGQEGGG